MITFVHTDLEVRVADDDHVEYDGRLYKLSPFVGTFLPDEKRTPSNSYCGTDHFTYKGEILSAIRDRLEQK